MSSSDTTGTTLETAVVEAVMLVTGHDLAGRLEGGLRLEDDLGVDSLALVELVEILQDRLDIVVPDEVTGQLRAIADLIAATTRLITPGANVAVLPQQHREGPR